MSSKVSPSEGASTFSLRLVTRKGSLATKPLAILYVVVWPIEL